MRSPFYLALLALSAAVLAFSRPAFGVATVVSGSTGYQTTDPFSGVSIWDCVGTINGSGGVYLGSGWVITCDHVLPSNASTGTFTMTVSGTTYAFTASHITSVAASGTVDLTMFYISGYSVLTSLNVIPFTLARQGASPAVSSNALMIGYGNDIKASGSAAVAALDDFGDTVGSASVFAPSTGMTYVSQDFVALSSSTQLIPGDSGGGVFIKRNGVWTLAGIMEATATSSGTYESVCVNIGTYYNDIESILTSTVPEPAVPALAAAGLGALWWARRHRMNRMGVK